MGGYDSWGEVYLSSAATGTANAKILQVVDIKIKLNPMTSLLGLMFFFTYIFFYV